MAYDNLLSIVGQFGERTGLFAPPTSVAASQDDTIRQVLALLNEGINDLSTQKWGPSEVVGGFTYTPPVVIPPITDKSYCQAIDLRIDFPDMVGLTFDTLYNSETRIPVNGPITEQDWATMVTLGVSQAQYAFRRYNTSLYIYPYPPAGQTASFTFRYTTDYLVLNTDAGLPGVAKPLFVLDTDFSIIPSNILLADLRFRYKNEKGLDFTKEFDLRNRLVTTFFNTDGNAPVVDMGDRRVYDDNSLVGPGLLIAAGNTIPVPP